MDWKGKRILVAGGAGFIGSHIVERLAEQGAAVTVADDLSRGKLDNLGGLLDRVEFRNFDLSVLQNCMEVCAGQEIVFNAAAKVAGIQYNRVHHAEMFYANMLLQMNLAEASKRVGVERFIQISTACIYRHDVNVPTKEGEAKVIDPEATNYGYGLAKHAGEKFAIFCGDESNMEVIVARFFNAIGKRDYYDDETSHVVPALIKRVIANESPLVVWGTGTQSRSFVDAKDLAKGLLLLAEKAPSGSIVNIGHDREIAIKELAKLVCELCGRKNARIDFDTSMPDGYRRRAADTTLLKSITGGWSPDTPLEESLKIMVAEYSEGSVQI